jgi:membrane dipeptidase
MLVDISHVSPAVMHAAINVSAAPVRLFFSPYSPSFFPPSTCHSSPSPPPPPPQIIFSHSNARALCDHIRNVPDDVLDRCRPESPILFITIPHNIYIYI